MALYLVSVLLKMEKVVQAEQIKERKEYDHPLRPSGTYDGVDNNDAPYADARIMPRWFGQKFRARTPKELQAAKDLEIKKEKEAHPSTPEERALERQREREEDDPWCVKKSNMCRRGVLCSTLQGI